MPVGLIQRFESPDAPTGAEENSRADQHAGLDVALSISPLGKANRHVDHGAFVRTGKQSSGGARICKALAPVATQVDRDPSPRNAVYANERRHARKLSRGA